MLSLCRLVILAFAKDLAARYVSRSLCLVMLDRSSLHRLQTSHLSDLLLPAPMARRAMAGADLQKDHGPDHRRRAIRVHG